MGIYGMLMSPTMADDPELIDALWRSEVKDAGGTPAGAPTWRLVTEVAAPDGEAALTLLRVEGPTL